MDAPQAVDFTQVELVLAATQIQSLPLKQYSAKLKELRDAGKVKEAAALKAAAFNYLYGNKTCLK